MFGGTHGSSISNILRNLNTLSHKRYINLHFHQQGTRVPLPNSREHLLYLVFLTKDSLTGMKLYFTVDFICISLIIADMSTFSYTCQLFGKMSIQFFCPFFLIGWFVLLLLLKDKSFLKIYFYVYPYQIYDLYTFYAILQVDFSFS